MVKKERVRQDRDPDASLAAVDSQSVKIGSFVSLETGINGDKKINGRKRHIAVDILGLPLAIHVSAANKHDGKQGVDLLWQLEKSSEKMETIYGDGHYKGEFIEYAKLYGWTVDIAKKPESKQGFVPQFGRWQVERSFGWFNFFRRLSKDYEKTVQSSVAFIQLAFIDIILARLAN